jgi:hypothetical protein
MKLITELSDVEYITEENNSKKDHYIVGKFIVGEQKNKNGRVYPLDVLEPEVERFVREMVKPGRAFGELGHPNGPSINLDRVSHMIVELNKSGNGFDGKAKITNTPMGNIVKGLLESGGKLGVSTRGMGSLVEKNGAMEVQKDFRLATIDCVSDPSGPGAFVNGIMEGVEYFYDPIKETWKEEKFECIKNKVKKMSKSQLEEQALSLFEDYFSLLVRK